MQIRNMIRPTFALQNVVVNLQNERLKRKTASGAFAVLLGVKFVFVLPIMRDFAIVDSLRNVRSDDDFALPIVAALVEFVQLFDDHCFVVFPIQPDFFFAGTSIALNVLNFPFL